MDLPPTFSLASGRSAGLTRAQLRGSGYLRLAHDLVVRLDDAIDLVETLQLLSTVLPPDAAYSHGTAAAVFGAPVDAPRLHHVALTPRRVLPQRNELIVHGRLLRPEDVTTHLQLRLTSGAQTFLDLAAVLPAHELVAVGDSLLRAGHLSAEALTGRLARADRVRGVVRARACAPLLSSLAMSRPESLIRYWVTTARLPAPQAQIPILDRWGRVVAHADLGFEEWKLALEYEGRQHADVDQFGRDVDRYSLMTADGWAVLRFATRHLHRSVVVDRTRRALISRGWRPSPELGPS
jgi:hypothetical protein